MNAITTADARPVSAETMEHVLGTGDLSRLTTQQRVEYYGHVCRTIGLNPLTRPFRFMSFQGQTVLYATRDCTDQLRNLRKINITIADKQLDGDLFIVTARATTADGRSDEDVGAVTLGQLKGDARANQIMKAMTKAKRRVTMSICGLGFLDESEVETLPGAKTFDADAEAPVARHPHNPPAVQETSAPAASYTPPAEPRRTIRGWLNDLRLQLAAAHDLAAVDAIATSDEVMAALRSLRNGPREELNALLAEAIERTTRPAGEAPAEDVSDDDEDAAGEAIDWDKPSTEVHGPVENV